MGFRPGLSSHGDVHEPAIACWFVSHVDPGDVYEPACLWVMWEDEEGKFTRASPGHGPCELCAGRGVDSWQLEFGIQRRGLAADRRRLISEAPWELPCSPLRYFEAGVFSGGNIPEAKGPKSKAAVCVAALSVFALTAAWPVAAERCSDFLWGSAVDQKKWEQPVCKS